MRKVTSAVLNDARRFQMGKDGGVRASIGTMVVRMVVRTVGTIAVALGLVAVPAVSSATPIGTNACVADVTGAVACDIFADYEATGASELGALEGNLGGYLVGYTVLLNQGADLGDGFQLGDVAHILVIHDQLFQLFSNNNVIGSMFRGIFTAATAATAIDGVALASGQLVGCPAVPDGVPHVALVGYCTTADTVGPLSINWAVDSDSGADILNIHTAKPRDDGPAPVPEPGTFVLLGLGGSMLVLLRRHRSTV